MPVRAFAKLADISEGTLRNMMLANDVSPRADNLAAVARVGNVMVDWLLTGLPPKRRHDFDVLAFNTSPEGITTLHIAEAKTYAAEPRASYGQPLRPDEAELLEKYRSAGDVGRHALNKVAKAVAGRSMRAWFDAGVAVSEAASILDQDK